MAIKSGLAAQIGFAQEAAWGTYQTPTRFLEFLNESLGFQIARIESGAIRASNRVLRSDHWAAGTKQGGGDIAWEVSSKGFGLLFKHMLGAVAITTPGGGTTSRDHTHTLGDPDANEGLTIQKGVPDVNGMVQPFSFLGCKVTGWELSNTVDGILQLVTSIDAADLTTAQSLAAASYPTSPELFTFVRATMTVGGAQLDVKDVSINGNVGLATDRFFLRSSQLKKEQLINGMYEIGGSLLPEFENLTAINRFLNGTTASLVALWEGSIIEAAIRYKVQVTIPVCRFDGDIPTVGSPEIVEQPLPFKGLYDGAAEPITLVYTTTDTAS